ncbi:MAG: efflux RND transporter periplasmic adaptor subunit [Marinagarivorans sp.]
MLKANCEGVRAQLQSLGISCKGVCVLNETGQFIVPLNEGNEVVSKAIEQAFQRVEQDLQLCIGKDGGTGFLVAYPVLTSASLITRVCVFWLEAISEQAVAVIRLAVGWLHLPLVQVTAEQGAQAINILESQAHILSQEKSRAGAQEWVNRLAQQLRRGPGVSCSVLYFRMLEPGSVIPHWWVTSDTASAEKGTALLHTATDAASAAAIECRELQLGDAWGFPVLHSGDLVGVLVVVGTEPDPQQKNSIRVSASTLGVLLSHWQLSDRGLWSHTISQCRDLIRKLREPGYLTWKLGAALSLCLMAVILLIPFEDKAVAKVVVEGQQQQTLAAAFDGYWAEVLVRPGDSVEQGQLLARLDAKDYLVEREKLQSEWDQANGKLRQALSDDDSSAAQQLGAQIRQTRAQLDLIDAKIQRAHIRAPVAGTIIFGDWFDQVGSPIEAGKKLFELAVGQGYRVVLQIPEEEIARVNPGQTGEMRLTGLPHERFNFRVNRVTAVATLDDHKNTFRVEAELTESSIPVRPGMQGVGKVVVTHSNLLTIWMRPVAQWARMKLWAMWW